MHNGYLNTELFSIDGNNITLAILSPTKLHEIQQQKIPKHKDCLLFVTEPILKASQHEFNAFKKWILSMEDEPESLLPTHPIARTLTQNFSHLFPEKIPTGLPPKREIQHHIDLVPGSILPNKPSYRINTKDTMEIQRQVEELHVKGLIHESLSRCTVPALLVPRFDHEWVMESPPPLAMKKVQQVLQCSIQAPKSKH